MNRYCVFVQIFGLFVDFPSNNQIVWVAAIGNAFGPNSERGIYKTVNGGKDWKKVQPRVDF